MKLCFFLAGPVWRIHRAPGAVRLLESFLLRLSADRRPAPPQQHNRDPIGRLQDLQAVPQTLLPPRGQHGRVAGPQGTPPGSLTRLDPLQRRCSVSFRSPLRS